MKTKELNWDGFCGNQNIETLRRRISIFAKISVVGFSMAAWYSFSQGNEFTYYLLPAILLLSVAVFRLEILRNFKAG